MHVCSNRTDLTLCCPQSMYPCECRQVGIVVEEFPDQPLNVRECVAHVPPVVR